MRVQSTGKFRRGVSDAIDHIERSLSCLETFLKINQQQQQQEDDKEKHSPVFFFGGTKPTSVDAFVFAALSALVYGKYSETSALTNFQLTAFGDNSSDVNKTPHRGVLRFPLCRRYAEAFVAS